MEFYLINLYNIIFTMEPTKTPERLTSDEVYPPPPKLMHTLNVDGRLGMFVDPTKCKCDTCVSYCEDNQSINEEHQEFAQEHESTDEDLEYEYPEEEDEEEKLKTEYCEECCKYYKPEQKYKGYCSKSCYKWSRIPDQDNTYSEYDSTCDNCGCGYDKNDTSYPGYCGRRCMVTHRDD